MSSGITNNYTPISTGYLLRTTYGLSGTNNAKCKVQNAKLWEGFALTQIIKNYYLIFIIFYLLSLVDFKCRLDNR